MIPGIDIYDSALILIRRHAGNAADWAATQAEQLRDQGNDEAYRAWSHIVRAVEDIQLVSAPSAQAAH